MGTVVLGMQRIFDVQIPAEARPWIFALSLLGIVVIATIVLALVKRSLRGSLERIAKRTPTHVDDIILAVLSKTSFFFVLFVALWIAPMVGRVPVDARAPMRIAGLIALLVQIAIWANAIITSLVARVLHRGGRNAGAATAATALAVVARIAVAAVILLVALDNLGFNVTAMIAGLGIGGLVVALALQNLLRDLLGALAIIAGRPFLVGEFIHWENVLGSVEYVGMRATQLRSLTGEEITIPNAKLLDSAIRNYTRRREFRAVINLRFGYDVPPATLSELPAKFEAIVASHERTRFDWALVKNLGLLGIEVDVVFYVTTTDFNEHMRIRHAINLEILEMLERQGIRVAEVASTPLTPQ